MCESELYNLLADNGLFLDKNSKFIKILQHTFLNIESNSSHMNEYVGHHSLKVYENSIHLCSLLKVQSERIFKLSALLHDCGKTPEIREVTDKSISYPNHEANGAKIIRKMLSGSTYLEKEESELLEWLVENHCELQLLLDSDNGGDSLGRILDQASKDNRIKYLLLLTISDIYRSDLSVLNKSEYEKRMRILVSASLYLFEIKEEQLTEVASGACNKILLCKVLDYAIVIKRQHEYPQDNELNSIEEEYAILRLIEGKVACIPEVFSYGVATKSIAMEHIKGAYYDSAEQAYLCASQLWSLNITDKEAGMIKTTDSLMAQVLDELEPLKMDSAISTNILRLIEMIEKRTSGKCKVLIHGDIHSRNLITREGKYYLIDFGKTRLGYIEEDISQLKLMNGYDRVIFREEVDESLVHLFCQLRILRKFIFHNKKKDRYTKELTDMLLSYE